MTTLAEAPLTAEPESVHSTRRSLPVLRDSLRLWRTRIGGVLLLLLALVALVGPYVAPHAPGALIGVPNARTTAAAPLGTDYLGQDVLSRFLYGGRPILLTALAATALGLVLGLIVGLVAAYARNALDDVLMRGMDVILAFPQIMLALVAIATVGPKTWLVIVAVGLTTMPRVARVTRGAAQPVVERDFIAAGEALGVPRWRILTREILPNILSPLMVEASLRLTYSIGVIAGLAFLGFATSPNSPDWGSMINQNYVALIAEPWGVALPVIAVALLTLGTGLIGDGIARAAAGIERPRAAE